MIRRVPRPPSSLFRIISQQKYLIAMSAPFVIWVCIFAYLPLAGWVMAFQDYSPRNGYLDQEWVGFKNFLTFLGDGKFYQVLRNTLAISVLHIVFGFFFAILLAVLLNELRSRSFKRAIQTISYLPHFVSWVVVASIFYTVLSPDGGVVNSLLLKIGIIREPVAWLAKKEFFWGIVTVAQVWKEMGWNAIIYLAAITSIDPQLYEAADMDGLGRVGKIFHITLPGIKGTIVVLLIISVGRLLYEAGFDPCFLLGNSLTRSHADNLAIYAFRYGISMTRYSLSTAISIFNSIVSLFLLLTANHISGKLGEGKII